MDETTDHADIVAGTAKMACGAALAWCSAYTLNEWVAIVTIAYVLLQIGLLLPKYYRVVADLAINSYSYLKILKKKKNGHKHKE